MYWVVLSLLIIGRAADFLSTFIATPNLVLEANPIAKRLGWKGGAIVNGVLCGLFAFFPLPAIVITTASLLVASRNFQFAWLMRTLGEDGYRYWMAERMLETSLPLYLFCLGAQAIVFTGLGLALVLFSRYHLVPLGIGMGIIAYSMAVLLFTSLSVWRVRRSFR